MSDSRMINEKDIQDKQEKPKSKFYFIIKWIIIILIFLLLTMCGYQHSKGLQGWVSGLNKKRSSQPAELSVPPPDAVPESSPRVTPPPPAKSSDVLPAVAPETINNQPQEQEKAEPQPAEAEKATVHEGRPKETKPKPAAKEQPNQDVECECDCDCVCENECIEKETQPKVVVSQVQAANTNDYYPYIEIGGTRFFQAGDDSWAASFDLFAPLWQSNDQILFIDPRYVDRPGKAYEINLHAGYRQLFDDEQKLGGIYGAFDRKRSYYGNYFNQLTFGFEYWQKLPRGNFFLGGNVYKPIGGAHFVGETNELGHYRKVIFRNVGLTKDRKYEKAMPGFDAEIGYEFVRGLIAYAGGYYFHAANMDPMYGPKIRLTYDWDRTDGKRVLGLFDKVGFGVGAQKDTPRGFVWYLTLNARLSWLRGQHKPLEGIARHMMDLIRRDVDIVSSDYTEYESRKMEKRKTKNSARVRVEKEVKKSEPVVNDSKQKQEPPASPPNLDRDGSKGNAMSPELDRAGTGIMPPNPSREGGSNSMIPPEVAKDGTGILPPNLPREGTFDLNLEQCQINGKERIYAYESDNPNAYLTIDAIGYNMTATNAFFDRTNLTSSDNNEFINKQTIFACCTDKSIVPTESSPYNNALNSTYTVIWPDQNILSCKPGEGIKVVECLCHHPENLAVFKVSEINPSQNKNETTTITAK